MKALIIGLTALALCAAQGAYAQSSQPEKRCVATTQKGTRCKNDAVNGTKYCQVHQAKAPGVQQCKAKTKSGSRCSKAAKTGGYCTQHYKMHQEGKI